MAHRTQSTPHRQYIEPPTPATKVRTISIPPEIILALGFGCMFLAIIAALLGAFK